MALGLLFILLGGGQILAQSVGTVFGDVVDSSGAVVTNAKVTVVSQERGLTRTVSTNASGQFTVPSLPPGVYNLAATAPGFQD